jgi:hypothetical protein
MLFEALAKNVGFVTYRMKSLIEWGVDNPVPLTTKKLED